MPDSTVPFGLDASATTALTMLTMGTIAQGGDLRERCQQIAEALRNTAAVSRAALFIVDGDGLVVAGASGPGAEAYIGSAVYSDEGLIGGCVRERRTHISDQVGEIDQWPGSRRGWMLVTPITEPTGATYGCVQLAHSGSLAERESYLAETVAFALATHFRTHQMPALPRDPPEIDPPSTSTKEPETGPKG